MIPEYPIPLPFNFGDPDTVRALVLRLARGAKPCDFAAEAEIPVEEFEQKLWGAVDNLLGVQFDAVAPPPEGCALVVCGEGLDQDEVTNLHDHFEQALPEGTPLIVSNFPIHTHVVGPLQADAMLIVTAEDCEQDVLDELRDQVENVFPGRGQSIVVANFAIDAKETDPSREDYNATMAALGWPF